MTGPGLQIEIMTFQHPLWEATAAFAERCSWKAGRFLAEKMRNRDFSETERVFAAAEKGEIIGYCTFALKDELPEDAPYSPFVGFVFVEENHRGRRISERLIRAAEEYARTLGYGTLYLMSGEKGLYEKYGFEKAGEFRTIYGTTDQLFRKRI